MPVLQVRFLRLTAAALLVAVLNPTFAQQPTETAVFTSGEAAHTYRIPSLIQAENGALLAFCEARHASRSDAGDIDLVVKRSEDGGATWSDAIVIFDDAENTCGNPCPVIDRSTGVVWLLMTWNAGKVRESKIQPGYGEDSRRVYLTHSDDAGLTWAKPVEITRDVKAPNWAWYATGPGAGIQITRGEHEGRLVIPCDHKVPTGLYRSHVIYSDDRGATWQLGGVVHGKTNECELVEIAGGRLMLNMRNADRKLRERLVSLSDDGGATWSAPKPDKTLPEPVCQASIRRLRWPEGDKPGVVLFSNPADKTKRRNLTIRASLDDAKTWAHSRSLYAADSAYSCLCPLSDGSIGCLYEKDGYKSIVLAKLDMDWLTTKPTLLDGTPPDVQRGVWVGRPDGEVLFAHRCNQIMPAASALKGALLIELFAKYEGRLDSPPSGVDAIFESRDHPAFAHYTDEEWEESRQALVPATVGEIGQWMIRTRDKSNKVYNGAANVTIALLGGPRQATRLIHARDERFKQVFINRYMLTDRNKTGDNLATPASLASVYAVIAGRDLPGLRPKTIDRMRRVLYLGKTASGGRHYFKAGGLATDPMAKIKSGWIEGDGKPLIYTVMTSTPAPNEASASEAAADALDSIAVSLRDRIVAHFAPNNTDAP